MMHRHICVMPKKRTWVLLRNNKSCNFHIKVDTCRRHSKMIMQSRNANKKPLRHSDFDCKLVQTGKIASYKEDKDRFSRDVAHDKYQGSIL